MMACCSSPPACCALACCNPCRLQGARLRAFCDVKENRETTTTHAAWTGLRSPAFPAFSAEHLLLAGQFCCPLLPQKAASNLALVVVCFTSQPRPSHALYTCQKYMCPSAALEENVADDMLPYIATQFTTSIHE